MFVDVIIERLDETVDALSGRVQRAADLSELLRTGGLPAAPVTAYVLPAGIRPLGPPDTAVGAWTQMVDEMFAVVIAVRVAGDLTGGKALPAIDRLLWAVIGCMAGHAPAQPEAEPEEPAPPRVFGAFRLSRGVLLSAQAGLVIYQIDFALQQQVRIIP